MRVARFMLFVTALLLGFCCESSFAQMPIQGQQSVSLNIGGAIVRCVPAVWVANYSLGDVGAAQFTHAGSVITYNPQVVASMPPRAAMFWLGHECGHITLHTSVETDADCWSVRTGVQQGWFGPSDLAFLKTQMANNNGDMTHPPGPERIALIESCLGIKGSTDGGGASDSQVSDTAANDCLSIHTNSVDWHKTQDNPTVDYSYNFSNTCDRAISCHSAVGIGYRPKGASDFSAFHQTDITEKTLTISPKDSKNVSGTMNWPTLIPTGTNPSIRHTRDDDTGTYAISCNFGSQ